MADRDSTIAEWWSAWRSKDFTWDGLTKHSFEGWVVKENQLRQRDTGQIYGQDSPENPEPCDGRKANLQDYWRADPATGSLREDNEMRRELVRAPQQPVYHRTHLPLIYANGEPTEKLKWREDALEQIISDRILVSRITEWPGISSSLKRELVDLDAQFMGAVFPSMPRSYSKNCSVNACFDFALFMRDCRFDQAQFEGKARFSFTAFLEGAYFDRSMFPRRSEFFGANFLEARFFGMSSFDNVEFRSMTSFAYAKFFDESSFQSCKFFDFARFKQARFYKAADFHSPQQNRNSTTFEELADFSSCTFSGESNFNRSIFKNSVDFVDATFEGISRFEKITWPEKAEHWHRAFDQTLFRGTAVFTGSGLGHFAAFDGATFERGVKIDEASEQTATETFNSERDAAIAAADDRTDRDARLRELERGCRVLKLAFERAADKAREQLMYRFELQARRAQSDLRLDEKLISDLYAFASDYGASMWRPLRTLGILVFTAAVFYWLCAVAFGVTPFRFHPGALDLGVAAQVLEFSLTNTFRPLSALSADSLRDGTLGAELLTHNDWVALIVRIVSIVQSLLSLVLAFLFGLAVRRRFQIS